MIKIHYKDALQINGEEFVDETPMNHPASTISSNQTALYLLRLQKKIQLILPRPA